MRIKKRHLFNLLNILIAAICIWLGFRGVHMESLLATLRNTSWWMVALSIVILIAMNVVKCAKLGIFLGRWSAKSLSNLFAAQMVGVLADTIIPFRAQEFVKAYVAGKMEKISVSRIIGVVIVEKAVEVLVLCSALALLSLLHDIPGESAKWIQIGWLVMLGGLVLLFLIAARAEFVNRLIQWFVKSSFRVFSILGGLFENIFEGLRFAALRPWAVTAVLGLTIFEWVFLGVAAIVSSAAIGITLTLPELLGLLTATFVAFAIPVRSSGALGVFEATGTGVMVLIFGMPKDQALSIVIVYHFVMIASGILGGLIGLRMTRLTWSDIKSHAKQISHQVKSDERS